MSFFFVFEESSSCYEVIRGSYSQQAESSGPHDSDEKTRSCPRKNDVSTLVCSTNLGSQGQPYEYWTKSTLDRVQGLVIRVWPYLFAGFGIVFNIKKGSWYAG